MPASSQAAASTATIYPKVLVVGMSRTGTESIKQAMELLYNGPAYHMSVVLNKTQDLKFWSDLAFGVVTPDNVDWQQILTGYIATTDLPCAHYFEPLAKAFPDAKVVLSVRDEQTWIDSYCRLSQAVYRFRFIRFLPPLNRFWPFVTQLNQLVFGEKSVDENGINRSVVLAAYRQHNEQVRQLIPAERLLEFNVEQGWQPLCEFLDIDVPKTPFPHSNAGRTGPTKILANAVGNLSLGPVVRISGGLLLIIAAVLALLKIQ